MPRGNSRPGSPRTATATSMDAVPFLKASLRLLSVLLRTPGESPRSSDRTVAAHWRRTLLEDTVLEVTERCFPEVVRLHVVLSPGKVYNLFCTSEFLAWATWCLSAASVVSGGDRQRLPVISSAFF